MQLLIMLFRYQHVANNYISSVIFVLLCFIHRDQAKSQFNNESAETVDTVTSNDSITTIQQISAAETVNLDETLMRKQFESAREPDSADLAEPAISTGTSSLLINN